MIDPIADMFTRIRNAGMANLEKADVPASKIKIRILEILKEEGYIKDFKVSEEGIKKNITVFLKYEKGKNPVSVIKGIKRISKPSRRIYKAWNEIDPIINGLGISIISTSSGIMSDAKAKEKKVGGEVICEVW